MVHKLFDYCVFFIRLFRVQLLLVCSRKGGSAHLLSSVRLQHGLLPIITGNFRRFSRRHKNHTRHRCVVFFSVSTPKLLSQNILICHWSSFKFRQTVHWTQSRQLSIATKCGVNDDRFGPAKYFVFRRFLASFENVARRNRRPDTMVTCTRSGQPNAPLFTVRP